MMEACISTHQHLIETHKGSKLQYNPKSHYGSPRRYPDPMEPCANSIRWQPVQHEPHNFLRRHQAGDDSLDQAL